MKNKILIIIFLIAWQISHAQIRPIPTNKLIVKTDLSYWGLDHAINAEAEFNINGKLTLNAGFYSGSRQYRQVFASSQYLHASDNVPMPDPGIINANYISLGFRMYLNRIIRAPFGAYYTLNLAIGKADISGEYDAWLSDYSINNKYTSDPGPVVNYSYFGLPLVKAQAGIGYQILVVKHISLDAALCYDYNDFIMSNKDHSNEISGLARNFGTQINLISHSGGIGFSALIKLGYLIF